MKQGSSDRIPASSLILFAAVVFTLTCYFTFNVLWDIAIPLLWVLVVLGLQFAVMLLGSSKVLTQLGAAALSAVIALAACIGAFFLVFPPILELKVAGAVGGSSAFLFIIASFVAASRVDPVPASDSGPLDMGNLEDDQTVELIKYGEVKAPDSEDSPDSPLTDEQKSEVDVPGQSNDIETEASPILMEKVYEFDELSESKLGQALGAEEDSPAQDPFELDEVIVTDLFDEVSPPDSVEEIVPELESIPDDEPVISDSWVEETAKSMAFEVAEDAAGMTAVDTLADEDGSDTAIIVEDVEDVEDVEERPDKSAGITGFRMRTRYKVLDAISGEHYGTYHGDEGFTTLDPVSLSELLESKLVAGELRIVKLDWSNFDEVEVHIKVEEDVPIDLDIDAIIGADESQISAEMRHDVEDGVAKSEGEGEGDETVTEVMPDSSKTAPEDDLTGEDKVISPATTSTLRYLIYDRRTIQPMGEYVPEGDRPRIDRLTLYKMFPEYNFKTFEIDSIRWEDDEVRIYIKGEKKQSPKSNVQSPKE